MTETMIFQGAIGDIEVYVDTPKQEYIAFALVCHPHPLVGGTPHHKVPSLLAKMLLEQGCIVYRPNFRGLGASQGEHDDGIGETEDMLLLIEQLHQRHPELKFYAAGFSFGAHVIAKCHAQLTSQGEQTTLAQQMILCGLPTADVEVNGLRRYHTPAIEADVLIIHGEVDEVCSLADLMQWARPQRHVVNVLPGANHYFTGYLNQMRLVISRFLKVT